MNFVDLVKLIITREEGEERKHFEEDTTHSPDVHLIPIVAIGH